MGLLDKNNKNDINSIFVDVSIYYDLEPYKIDILISKVKQMIQTNLNRVIDDKDYTLKQLYYLWAGVAAPCDLRNFAIDYDRIFDEIDITLTENYSGDSVCIMSIQIDLDYKP